MITTSGNNWPPLVEFCRDTLGADNVLFAVDYPFEDNRQQAAMADTIGFTAADRHKFFHENAERFFKL